MRFAFNTCEIDTGLFQISRDGVSTNLTPQTAQLLLYLIENRDRVVLKEELIEQVWDGRAITDASLSTAIKEVRQVVGDSGRDQRVVRTVHGKGFQFIAEIKAGGSKKPDQQASDQSVIAVLPFRSLGSDTRNDGIAEGLTEDTIACLSRFREFALLSHRTTVQIAADNLSDVEMHRSFGITHVIEGSIRRSNKQIRVTVQVTDATNGQLVATEQFNRGTTTEDLFDIQEEIARLIAGRLGSRHGMMANQITQMFESGRTTSWEIYLTVSRFYEYYRTYDPAVHADARDRFLALLTDTTQSSDGWASYAMLLLEEYRYHINPRPDVDALALASDAARKAVACDSYSAFAQMVLALTVFYQKDIPGFRVIAARALDLNPGHCDVLAEIGSCHLFLGEYARAVELLDRAIELSPVHPGWYHYARCWLYADQGYTEAALLEIEKVPMPEFFWYQAHLAWLHAELGNMPQARAAADVMRAMYPEFETYAWVELDRTNISPERGIMAVKGWIKAGLDVKETAT